MGWKNSFLPCATLDEIFPWRLWHQWSGTSLPISGGGGGGIKGLGLAAPPWPNKQVHERATKPCWDPKEGVRTNSFGRWV